MQRARRHVIDEAARIVAASRAVRKSTGAWIDPVAFAERALGFPLDPWQADIMQAAADSVDRLAVNAARQSGKSTVCAVAGTFLAATRPGFRLVLIAPSFRQASLLRDKIRQALALTDTPHTSTRDKLSLLNGSTVLVLPGDDPDKVRGHTASMVLIDEAAFVKESVVAAVGPMLASTGGALWGVSTPNGTSGFFFELFHSGNVKTIHVKAAEIGRFDPSVIADLRGRLGDVRAGQELDGAFVASASSVFDAAALDRMFAPTDADLSIDDAGVAEEQTALEQRYRREKLNAKTGMFLNTTG